RAVPGLYEELITLALDRLLTEGYPAHLIERAALTPDAAHDLLARHLHKELERALKTLAASPTDQATLANDVLELLRTRIPALDPNDAVLSPPEALHAIGEPHAQLVGDGEVPPRPSIPLISSDLLVNARHEPRVGQALKKEIPSADRIDLLCAFIQWRGLRVLKEELAAHLKRGRKLRVLTTTYMGATQRRADRALNATRGTASTDILLVDLKPYPHQVEILDRLDTERTRHGRFKNLVVAATGTGKTMVAAFDFARWYRQNPDATLLFVAHRQEILEQSLKTFRAVLRDGSFGELLVGGYRPTAWKHVFASIQSLTQMVINREERRLPAVGGARAPLVLNQQLNELPLISNISPTIKVWPCGPPTAGSRRTEKAGAGTLHPKAYTFLIIDEFHHAEARTYTELLDHIQPNVLLGLTATPERADGQSVLHWFDGRMAAEIRLWEALDRQLLVPFQYFGVHDNTDLGQVSWSGGKYQTSELENLYTADHARVAIILRELDDKVQDITAMRALGFCVSIAHAEFMAREFNRRRIPSIAQVNSRRSHQIRISPGCVARRQRCAASPPPRALPDAARICACSVRLLGQLSADLPTLPPGPNEAAFGLLTPDTSNPIREGVRYLDDFKTDLFFITLDKAEEHYSPRTMYKDYAISPTLFHWESQWNTTEESPTGQRYVRHKELGTRVFLFVRDKKKIGAVSQPYVFLGPAEYVRHEGERPMGIVWKLERAMPGDLFLGAKVVAG
ncbi:MAG: DUF3427 domain-containing protein, partial [Bradymonadaceae bacterium]